MIIPPQHVVVGLPKRDLQCIGIGVATGVLGGGEIIMTMATLDNNSQMILVNCILNLQIYHISLP